ncbi:ThuA domain-containing protein [Fibrella sp. HMF5335]|uniref:ThuA domain-containing protein n=1 Tax=Fibrella rubiginis TaxID=2817060 RepID=A0A939GN88_9BACT|nr:ThuA domain-containing protein [Fibrella rubiginis]MBO0939557.1 ThuA domain-containing protein [Fibrella rubiginis]
MVRKLLRFVLFTALALALLMGGFVLFAMYSIRKLPWQHPVFDTTRPADPGPVGDKGVLVFSKTNGFRHESIEPGVVALKTLGAQRGWTVVGTENGAFFNDDYLQKFKVVVWLSTTGDVLTPDQQAAFERFIERGGGYVGIHAACDTEYDWLWYDQLLGTHFRDHSLFPHTPEATLTIEDKTHPSTTGLPATWRHADEWYNFRKNPRTVPNIHVLLNVDEKTYDVGETKGMGGDHPISWTHNVGQGRMFYTALGHTAETFTEKNALQHIEGGIVWAGGF